MSAVCADLGAYRGFLSPAPGCCGPIKTVLARLAWQALGLDDAPRCRVPLPLADLRALGVAATTLQQPDQCRALAEPLSITGAFGAVYVPEYVLDGATLGGQPLLRMVQAGLGLSRAQGAAFHQGYGLEDGLRWRAFRACAEQHLIDPAVCGEAVQMERQTFETIWACLTAKQAPAQPDGQTRTVAA